MKVSTLAIIAAVSPILAFAQGPAPAPDPLDWTRQSVANFVANQPFGWTLAQINRQMSAAFRFSSLEGQRVTAETLKQHWDFDRARLRGQNIGRMLGADASGDNHVTREEYRQQLERQLSQSVRDNKYFDSQMNSAFEDDANKDGILDLAEIKAGSDRKGKSGLYGFRDSRLSVPLELDANRDGVDLTEYQNATKTIFDEIDQDKSGDISEEEVEAWQPRRQAAQQAIGRRESEERARMQAETQAKACGFPAVPEGAAVAFVGAYEGAAVSSVSIDGDDTEVNVADVVIEPGDKPLYLALASFDPMIWRFSGDVKRVIKAVATSVRGNNAKVPRVGVTGLPKAKIAFLPRTDCIPYDERGADTLAGALGRNVDFKAVTYELARAQLPSGQVSKDAAYDGVRKQNMNGPAAEMWRESNRFAPGGVVDVDPAAVVSNLPIAKFRVLPQQAGLAQLIEEGALTSGGRYLRINKQITIPAGLNGAHRVDFILGKGVPEPKGSLGHSCLVSEENPADVKGVACRNR